MTKRDYVAGVAVRQTTTRSRRRAQTARAPVGLDATAIVTAALALIDDEGLPGFTIRALSARLRVQAPTLYWHVGTKADLLQAVVDRVVIETAAPVASRGTWEQRVRHFFVAVRAPLVAHPNLIDLMRSVHSRAIECWITEALAIVRAAGCDEDRAPAYARIMVRTALSCAQSEANMRATDYMETDPADPSGRRYRVKPEMLRPDLDSGVARTTSYDVDTEHELTTTLFIAGLRAELERAAARR
jgi:AcrR family transcriptional regulator